MTFNSSVEKDRGGEAAVHDAVPDPAEIHRSTIVVNGCAPTRGNLESAIGAYIAGGVTATNLTVMNNENFSESGRWLGKCLRTIRRARERGTGVRVIEEIEDVFSAKEANETGIILGTQNADPIEDDLSLLEVLRGCGVRILQLTYQRRNRIGDGCGEESDAGLSLFGREVVAACNDLGIMIDVSHVGRKTTLDAIRLSRKPVVITHSNAYSLHRIERNKRDEDIRAVVDSGGMMGVTSVSRYLSSTGGRSGTTLPDYVEHLEYLVELVGKEAVGIGLDVYEGMTVQDFEERRSSLLSRFPELQAGGGVAFEHYYVDGLSSGAQLPSLTEALVARGWEESAIRNVLGQNFLSLFRRCWT